MKLKILKLMITFFSIGAITVNLNPEIEFIDSFSGNSAILCFIFIIIYAFSNKIVTNKKCKKISICISIILSIVYILGMLINDFGDIFVFGSKGQLAKLLIALVGYFWIFYNVLKYIYSFSREKLINIFSTKRLKKLEDKIFSHNILSFFTVMILIFLAWLPYLLQYYPGVVTNDSLNQIYQGIGLHQITTHHPVIHTMIIGECMRIGNFIQDYNLGIAIYSTFQMLIMSAIFSYTIYYMAKKNIPTLYRLITLIYFMFYQVHALYAISMWKDVLFAGVFLLFTITLIEAITEKDEFFNRKYNNFRFIILMIFVMLFRNNGFYAIIITTPFLIYTFRNRIKNILIIMVASYAIYAIITGPLYSIMKVEPGSIREALSVPMQQISRTVTYHKDELSNDERSKISNYIKVDIDEIPNLYNPIISDPIKEKFDGDEFSENKLDFIKLWFHLLIEYPKDYINAFIYNCYGYWYPNASYWVTLDFTQNDSYIGISEDHKMDSNIIKKYSSLKDERNIPIVSMLYSIGFNVWIIFILIGKLCMEKNKKYLIAFVPLLALWFTTLASPVFCEYRYIYSIFTCQPVLIAYVFLYNKNKEEIDENCSTNTML